ncbi:MAG TPA: type IV pilin N-terminal domain-containing protein [Methanocella sp.]|nr:type IV pilin N-terminal domain-containing protein [Methanocella sp.]
MERHYAGNEDAVSELIGEMMVLFITVAVFALLIATANGLMGRPRTDIVAIGATNNSSTVLLTHMGGDSLAFGDIGVIVNGHATPYTRADGNDNGLWDLGEALAVASPPPGQELDLIVYDAAAHAVLGEFSSG